MNRSPKSIAALILSAVLLTSTFTVSSATTKYDSQIEANKDKLNTYKSEINALKEQLEEKKKEQAENQAAIKKLEAEQELTLEKKDLLDKEMMYLIDMADITQSVIDEYNASIEVKKADVESTKEQIAEQQKLFTDHFRNNYEQGSSKIKYLEFLFNSTSIGDFLSGLHYVASMMDYEQYLIKNMEKLVVQLESQTADLNDLVSEQTEQLAVLDAQKAEIDKLDAEPTAYMEKLLQDTEMYIQFNKEIDDDAEAIANWIQEETEKYNSLNKTQEWLESQKEAELEAIKKAEEEKKEQEEAASKPSGGSSSSSSDSSSSSSANVSAAGYAYDNNSVGRWQWPVNYKKGKYTSPWGSRTDPVTGEKDTHHNGIDLALAKGNNIYAVEAGVVIRSEWWKTYGNCVIILHDNGMKTLYAHASKLLVKTGDRVAQGTVIALVGSTGKSTGNHLHFTVYDKNGNDVNPFKYYPTLSKGLPLYD